MVKRRKSSVLPPPSVWPLNRCMGLLGAAWTAHVLWYLGGGERCFTELQTDIRGVSAKVLTSRLRRLEREGILERHVRRTSPPTVWYYLTSTGHDLCAALTRVVHVAQQLKPTPAVRTSPRS